MNIFGRLFTMRSRARIDRLRRNSSNGESEWLDQDHNQKFAVMFPDDTVKEVMSRDLRDKRVYEEMEESVGHLRRLRSDLNGG